MVRALTAFAEHPASIPRPRGWLSNIYNPSPGKSNTHFWPPGAQVTHVAHNKILIHIKQNSGELSKVMEDGPSPTNIQTAKSHKNLSVSLIMHISPRKTWTRRTSTLFYLK